ncbi:MAG: hypothetical protein HQM02_05095, partial [Magnetococcales bacterium]|nr:hypothetical protein [Magnetococcales bacterium]
MSYLSDSSQNPFFATFGRLVERFFSTESQAGEPVALSWQPSADEAGEEPALGDFIPGEEVKQTREAVELLRRSLHASAGRGMDELRSHFRDFRTAVKSGNEGLMKENPFYEL